VNNVHTRAYKAGTTVIKFQYTVYQFAEVILVMLQL